jgi:hypothetical protein
MDVAVNKNIEKTRRKIQLKQLKKNQTREYVLFHFHFQGDVVWISIQSRKCEMAVGDSMRSGVGRKLHVPEKGCLV